MCELTVIADDVTFADGGGFGGYRVEIHQRGQCAVHAIISEEVFQLALHRAIKALEAKKERSATVIAFPMPLPHADTA
jgi:hypothetical protein